MLPQTENSAKLYPFIVSSYASPLSIDVLYIGNNNGAYDNKFNKTENLLKFIQPSTFYIQKGLTYFQNFLGKKTIIFIPPNKYPLLYRNYTTRGWTVIDLIKK